MATSPDKTFPQRLQEASATGPRNAAEHYLYTRSSWSGSPVVLAPSALACPTSAPSSVPGCASVGVSADATSPSICG